MRLDQIALLPLRKKRKNWGKDKKTSKIKIKKVAIKMYGYN